MESSWAIFWGGKTYHWSWWREGADPKGTRLGTQKQTTRKYSPLEEIVYFKYWVRRKLYFSVFSKIVLCEFFKEKTQNLCSICEVGKFRDKQSHMRGVSDYPQSHDASIHQASGLVSLSVEFKVWLAWLVCPLVTSIVTGWLTNIIDGSVCLSQIGDFGVRSFWKWQMMTAQFGRTLFKQGHVYVRRYTVFHLTRVSVMTHRRGQCWRNNDSIYYRDHPSGRESHNTMKIYGRFWGVSPQ